MKGVRRDVVEIQELKDENIEKVLVFFKPGCPAVHGTQEEAALGYADRLTTWRKGRAGLYSGSQEPCFWRPDCWRWSIGCCDGKKSEKKIEKSPALLML